MFGYRIAIYKVRGTELQCIVRVTGLQFIKSEVHDCNLKQRDRIAIYKVRGTGLQFKVRGTRLQFIKSEGHDFNL